MGKNFPPLTRSNANASINNGLSVSLQQCLDYAYMVTTTGTVVVAPQRCT